MTGFLFLFLIGIPLLFFSSAIATDFTLMTLGRAQAGHVAESAAVAGAFQQQTGSSRLDREQARIVAEQVVRDSINAGVANTTVNMRLDGRPTVSNSRVTVKLRYRVPYTMFSRFFGTGASDWEIDRSAEVCVPGTPGSTNGFCARPRG